MRTIELLAFASLLSFSVQASYFPEYVLGKDQRVLFAITSSGVVSNPPEVLHTFALPITDTKHLSRLALDNCASDRSKRKYKYIPLSSNSKWNNFQFWETGSAANEQFSFTINRPHILDVTDYKCAGDSFTIVNVDENDEENIIASTIGNGAFDDCVTYADTAQIAWNSPNFHHVRHLLLDGKYNLQIFANESPTGAGAGALRLMPVRISETKRGDLRLVENKLPWRFAAQVCDWYGLELAHIEDAKQASDAFKLVLSALGADKTAFIAGFGEHRIDREMSENPNELASTTSYLIYAASSSGKGQIIASNGPVPLSHVLCKDPRIST